MAAAKLKPIVKPGRNCWRIETAERASVIIDAADYFHFIREAMEAAQRRILLLGWDFDPRISLEPHDEGKQETLYQFFLRLAHDNPKRAILILKWSFGTKLKLVKPKIAYMLARWYRTKAIDYQFDDAHPPGCSHHQKVVVIDDQLAVCGGIDVSSGRWDTPEHLDKDPRRTLPDGSGYDPWHDVTMMMSGDVAQALGELGRGRWSVATKAKLSAVKPYDHTLWPDDLPVDFENVSVAIARTRAPFKRLKEIREIEKLTVDMIAAAQRFIYIENQYLSSPKVAAAIAKRLKKPNPPDIVLVMPRTGEGWLEQRAMDAARIKLVREIAKVDPDKRFRVYVPVNAKRTDIYVHAKVMIVDDRILRIGSANLNNRSLGLDSECDVAIDAALKGNENTSAIVRRIREKLIAEHLNVTPAKFAKAYEKAGSLTDAIEKLRGKGKTLDLLDLVKPGPLDDYIAENELLDPEHADGFLEPLSQRGLWKRWRQAKDGLRARG